LPAISDIIIDNKNGLNIDEKNTDSIFSAVSWLLENPSKREKLSIAGRNYVNKHFDWSIISHQYLSLIKLHINNQ
jgi:glycosyltransferase involved in cell wall biosynthesis